MIISCSKDIAITSQMKECLVELMSNDPDILKGPFAPEDTHMWAIFFESNGYQMALVSTATAFYRSGNGRGTAWDVYRFEKGRWQIKEGGVFALPQHIYILIEEGQKAKTIAISEDFYRSKKIINGEIINGYEAYRDADQIVVDSEGNLKLIPIPEFTVEKTWFDYVDVMESDEIGIPPLKLKSPNDKLEPVKVETFYPKKKNHEMQLPSDFYKD